MFLHCLIVTTTLTIPFQIEVEEEDTIDNFKERIKEIKYYNFDGHVEFTLWKINLPTNKLYATSGSLLSYAPFYLCIKNLLNGVELNDSKRKIKEIFPAGFGEDLFSIAIMVKPVPNNLIYVFVDDSNLFIEGKYAVGRLEQLSFPVAGRGLELGEFRIDHSLLHNLLLKGREIGSKPVLVGSRPPSDESLWNFIRQREYEVTTLARNSKDREKGVDNTLGNLIDKLVDHFPPGILILVAGDGDYYSNVKSALDRNWIVEIWFWKKATCGYLKTPSENMVFHPLDDYYKTFSFGKGLPTFKSNLEFLTLIGDCIKNWKNKDLLECFMASDLFGWLRWEDDRTVHLHCKKEAREKLENWIEQNWIKTNQGLELRR